MSGNPSQKAEIKNFLLKTKKITISVGIIPNSKEVSQMTTPRWQELGPTCLLQLLVPEPLGPHRNPKSPKPSDTIKNPFPELQNLKNPEPIEWNHLRFPEPGSFPDPPQLAQNTPKSILRKDPIAFCCWGKNQTKKSKEKRIKLKT